MVAALGQALPRRSRRSLSAAASLYIIALCGVLSGCGTSDVASSHGPPETGFDRVVLYELFVGLGCTKCPLAEAALDQLLAEEPVGALAVIHWHPGTYWGPTLEGVRYLTSRLGLTLKGHCFSRTDSLSGFVDEYLEFQSTLTLSYLPALSVSLTALATTTPLREFEGRDSWVAILLRYCPRQKVDLHLSLGRERGGITCSGGLCHYESPFSGVRFGGSIRL